MIDKLLKHKEKLDLTVIDETYYHERIEIHFKEPVNIAVTNKYEFFNVQEIIYNVTIKDVMLCIEDEYPIGYIPNESNIWLIYSQKEVLYERGVTND